ncbi:MAG: hypothetical protein K0S11_990 [Gammaproteobacteria bacterium]|jgi:hypothetical protein|nr:hypothetical protein [Gammaproteobacteria bacterium]
MFENTDRRELRQFYFEVWRKHQQQQALEPLEQQILHIIQQHPEYQDLFNNPEKYLVQDYLPEMGKTNPFLHLSLHQALLEQITTDRPTGIRAIYTNLARRHGIHETEHQIMEVLTESLYQGIQQGKFISEADYLERLKRLT